MKLIQKMERRGGGRERERDRGHEVRNRNGAIKPGRLTNRVKVFQVCLSTTVLYRVTSMACTPRYYIILLDSRPYNNNFHVTNISMEWRRFDDKGALTTSLLKRTHFEHV